MLFYQGSGRSTAQEFFCNDNEDPKELEEEENIPQDAKKDKDELADDSETDDIEVENEVSSTSDVATVKATSELSTKSNIEGTAENPDVDTEQVSEEPEKAKELPATPARRGRGRAASSRTDSPATRKADESAESATESGTEDASLETSTVRRGRRRASAVGGHTESHPPAGDPETPKAAGSVTEESGTDDIVEASARKGRRRASASNCRTESPATRKTAPNAVEDTTAEALAVINPSESEVSDVGDDTTSKETDVTDEGKNDDKEGEEEVKVSAPGKRGRGRRGGRGRGRSKK